MRVVEREGWEVVGKFKDEALSGANASRPGYQELLAAAKRRDFDIIVVEEVSRLWRDQEEQWHAGKRLEYCGVHIVGVNDGINTRAEGYGLLLSIRGAMNEEGRREIAKRTHRGLEGVARNGHSAGGRCYGYRSVPIEDPSRHDQYGRPVVVAVRREVDPEQAKWVRLIFERYADGHSPRRIADELNRLGVPSPGASWNRQRRDCKAWASSAIYGDRKRGFGILINPLYAGLAVWNRTRRLTDPDTKARKHAARKQDEWVTREAPELRIVSPELWERVQARLAARSASGQGKRNGTGFGPTKYLFSGLLKCGVCSGSYVVINYHSYGCATHKDRGEHACANGRTVPRRVVEERVLRRIKDDLHGAEFLEEFKREAARLLKLSRGTDNGNREDRQRRLAQAEREIENLMTAIKAGIITPTTKAELERLEAERERLLSEPSKRKRRPASLDDYMAGVRERHRALVERLEDSALEDVARTREDLMEILERGEVVLQPKGLHLQAEFAYDAAPVLIPLEFKQTGGTEERT